MRIVLCLAALVAISGLSVAAQDQKPAAPAAESKMPPEAAKVPNPVKPTAASLAAGGSAFGKRGICFVVRWSGRRTGARTEARPGALLVV